MGSGVGVRAKDSAKVMSWVQGQGQGQDQGLGLGRRSESGCTYHRGDAAEGVGEVLVRDEVAHLRAGEWRVRARVWVRVRARVWVRARVVTRVRARVRVGARARVRVRARVSRGMVRVRVGVRARVRARVRLRLPPAPSSSCWRGAPPQCSRPIATWTRVAQGRGWPPAPRHRYS